MDQPVASRMHTHQQSLRPNDPLMEAIKANRPDRLNDELAARYAGQTPPDMLVATVCKLGHLECLDVLLEAGARTGVLGALFGATPLHLAAAQNLAGVVDRLIAHGVPVNRKDYSSQTPLHDAINAGHAGMVEHLIQKGADWRALQFRDGDRRRGALEQAMVEKKLPDVAVVLIRHGAAGPAWVDAQGNTWLHIAARQRWEGVTQALIAQGLEIDAVNLRGQTSLGVAVRENAPGCVRLLVEHGADPDHPQGEWGTPMNMAQRMSPVLLASIEQPLMAHAVRDAQRPDDPAPAGRARARL